MRRPEVKSLLVDLGVDGRIILKFIVKIGIEGVDWADLAQDRDVWRSLASTVMDFLGLHKYGEFLD